MIPVSVLIPTRDSMALLRSHMETVEKWLDLVEEVVVVDSESTDGTVDYLKGALRGTNVRFFGHPRGLYQSWNFGVAQIRSKFTYISTVGDEMTREGLLHLAEVALRFNCDVVVSKPNFVDEDGSLVSSPEWPIDRIVRCLAIKEPCFVEGPLLELLTLVNYGEAVLGSSASNLYLTSRLRTSPFPLEYGTVGDGAWGHLNASKIRLGVTPNKISFFRFHAKPYSASEYHVDNLHGNLKDLALNAFKAGFATLLDKNSSPALTIARSLIGEIEKHDDLQRTLVGIRKSRFPWIFRPDAWLFRHQRNKCKSTSERLTEQLVRYLRTG